MMNERYDVDLAITMDDFEACGWAESLANVAHPGYWEMWKALSDSARIAISEERKEHGKVLWLLADACSMTLVPESQNEAFKATSSRSILPDNLSDSDIDFFIQIQPSINEPWLKARIADLCWFKRKPKELADALDAIDAYRRIPLDIDTLVRDGRECWERGIFLARILKGGAGDRLKEIGVALREAFDKATDQDGYLAMWLADLLENTGLTSADRIDIASKLETIAKAFHGDADYHRARDYYSSSSNWYRKSGDTSKDLEMKVELAESWVADADARIASADPSHMVAAGFYENAIQIYRSIPKSERATHKVDERILELKTLLNQSGELALNEMGMIETPEMDISQIVDFSRKSVLGKPPVDALAMFANLRQGAKYDELRKSAEDRLRQFPLNAFFPATYMSRDGRVIAKHNGLNFGEDTNDANEVIIHAEIMQNYGLLVALVVQSAIWPAHEAILLEHRLSDRDFISLARNSPIVPTGRETLFGKALSKGYDRDFTVSLHLLAPQIEHMVRFHLKNAGAITTTLDQDGIEMENGLSTLIETPKVEAIFGKDLAFELKALFCDSLGSNLRNEIAHGLLEETEFYSAHAIYAWWLSLRIVLNSWWNRNHQQDRADEQGQDPVSDPDQGSSPTND